MKLLFAALIAVSLFTSCQPDNPNDPQPTNPQPVDTLSTGWTRITQIPFYNTLRGFSDVFFINNNTGFLLGNSDTLYKSTDGGRNWSIIQTFRSGSGFAELGMGSDQNISLSGGSDTIYSSKNGGLSFNKVYSGVFSPSGIFYTSPTEIFASCRQIIRSQNGGDSWQVMYSKPITGGAICSPFFLNSMRGWDISEGGLYQTTDGGVNWTKNAAFTFASSGVSGVVQFVDVNNGFVSLRDGLYKTTNGGASWTKITAADALRAAYTSPAYPDVHFLNANTGYYLAGRGVYRTDDGGSTWTREVLANPIVSAAFIELHFTDANHGWACGTDGIFFRYER